MPPYYGHLLRAQLEDKEQSQVRLVAARLMEASTNSPYVGYTYTEWLKCVGLSECQAHYERWLTYRETREQLVERYGHDVSHWLSRK
jgi:hypothetical protein